MRFRELQEASIFTRGTYTYGHKVKIANSKKGKILLQKIQDQIPNFAPEEILTWVDHADPKSSVINLGKRATPGDIKHFERSNGEIISILGSNNTIESSLNHAGESIKFNRGDIAEGVLGAALTAKLIKRGSDKIGEVTPEDVKKVLASTVKNNDNLVYTVNDKNSKIADRIIFSIKLTGPSLDIINNQEHWTKFESLFSSSSHYVNSTDAERYSNYFYKNGKVDEVYITSDGLSGQKSRKTDISAVVRDPATGKVKQLKNLDISLKADSKQFGQIGTGGAKAGVDKWIASAKKLFEPFGIEVTPPTTNPTNITNFFVEMYEQAGKKITDTLSHASLNQETSIVEKIADVISHQATLKVPNLRIVNLEKGESSIHSFSNLKQRMFNARVDLEANLTIGRSGYPTITIYDKTSKKYLVKIRYFSTKLEDKTAHVFEKGPLLHDLTMIIKNKEVAKSEQSTNLEPKTKSPSVKPALKVSQPTIGAEPANTTEV
jgi:hypothetical protein